MYKRICLFVLLAIPYIIAMEHQNKTEKPVFKNELCELLYNLMNKDCATDVTTKTTEFLLFKSKTQLTNENICDTLGYAIAFTQYIRNQYEPWLMTATPTGPFNYKDTNDEMNSCLKRIEEFCNIISGQIQDEQ